MIRFLHIPKTGGMALWQSLETCRSVSREHGPRLSELPATDPVITILREPVARFVSAFGWLDRARLLRWATPEELARSLPDPLMDEAVLRPMSWWLDVDRPLLWVGRTERLDADARHLAVVLGLSVPALERVNVTHRTYPPLSPAATAAVRDWYAEDYQLLERFA